MNIESLAVRKRLTTVDISDDNFGIRLKEAEDTLRMTVSRLAHVASGSDSQLDEQLGALGRLTQGTPDNPAIRSLLKNITATIGRLDAELSTGNPRRLPSHRFLAHVLKNTELPKKVRKKAAKLEKALQHRDAGDAIGEHVARFCELVNDSIRLSVDASKKDKPKKHFPFDGNSAVSTQTLIQELFSQLKRGLSDEVDLNGIHDQMESAFTEAELRIAVTRLVGVLQQNEKGWKAKGSATNRTATVDTPTQERFTEFLDMLSLPEKLNTEAMSIKQRLSGKVTPLEWPPLLSNIADIIANLRSELENERSELQEFLHLATAQLQNIDSTFVDTEEQQQMSFNAGMQMNEVVRTNLIDLKTSVQKESDISRLRQIISIKMAKINAHLQDHRNSESKRHTKLSDEMKVLRSKVTSLESQTTELSGKLVVEREQSRHDPLTGIANRIAYEQGLEDNYQRWTDGEIGLSIIVCDVDRFKALNDKLGHQAGDKALKSIAKVLKKNVRKGDILARYSGEEFVVLIPHNKDMDGNTTKKVSEKLRREVEKAEFKYHGEAIPVTISCGCAVFQDGDERDAPFNRADQALYRAKELGRNRVEAV